MAEPAPIPAAASVPVAAPVESSTDLSKFTGTVKSPMVGVVYLASDPSSPDYVKIGDNVSQGDTVCLIEAMKTFNPVKAHVSGKVTKILVESGDPVEYGEPLIVIE
jgi:acetyl-CoA carboxylase biotin carboxyl carrier protein